MHKFQRLTYRSLVATTLVLLGMLGGGNAYAFYDGNPYAPQTQYVCTNTPYYHCQIHDPTAAQNPYAYQNPYGYGAGYMAGGGYNVDYNYQNWGDRDNRLIDNGAIANRGEAIRGSAGRGR